jgi:hypothetical protein
MQGKQAEATALLRKVVADATTFTGTASRCRDRSLRIGIALLGEERFDEGIAELRKALEIRRAAFPGNTIQVAESLSGLGRCARQRGQGCRSDHVSDRCADACLPLRAKPKARRQRMHTS